MLSGFVSWSSASMPFCFHCERTSMSLSAAASETKILREISEQSAHKPTCLVVGMGDESVVKQVVAVAGPPVVCVILKKPEVVDEVTSVFETLADHSIREIILVGQTKTDEQAANESLQAASGNDLVKKLVTGARMMDRRLAFAKGSLGELCQHLGQIRQEAVINHGTFVDLTGLLYVSHSDFFLRYNSNTEAFTPLRKTSVDSRLTW